MNIDVPFDENAVCDECGKKGAFDFHCDFLCGRCVAFVNARKFATWQAKAKLGEEAIDLLELIVDDFGVATNQMGRDFLVRVGKRVPCPSCEEVVRPIGGCNQCGAKLKEIEEGTP